MANKTIADYTAAITIDGANDFLLIEPSGNTVYKRISRNILLGLSSAPLGLTDSQSPTNKTFDNTNTVTLKDTLFTLQDDGDTSKQAKFQLSSITTATTRTYTLPNASDTLTGIATAQTLTNKTITSPTISGGTIDNATITVDSIAGHTSSTLVTVANLQISNGVLNSANAVTATSIAAGAVQPQALVAGTGSGWAWQSYAVTWSGGSPSIGNGTLTGRYIQIGKTVFFRIDMTAGSSTTFGSGAYSFSLPVTSVSYHSNLALGNGFYEAGGIADYAGPVAWNSTTSVIAWVDTGAGVSAIGSATPVAWNNTSYFRMSGFYEAA